MNHTKMPLTRRILSLLLNQEVVEFTCPEIWDALYGPDDPTPLWKRVLQKCPSLEKFTCGINRVLRPDHSRLIESAMSMKHLQVLELKRFWCDDSNLCAIAEQLPNLR